MRTIIFGAAALVTTLFWSSGVPRGDDSEERTKVLAAAMNARGGVAIVLATLPLVLGANGGMVLGLLCVTNSGRAAMATRLTDAAATTPPAMPAALKKCLLECITNAL